MRSALALVLALASVSLAQSDPADDGPHLVRRVELRVTHPDGSTSELPVVLPAAPAGPRPVVLFFHGGWVGAGLYARLAESLASRGLAVALFDQVARFSTDLPAWVDGGRLALDALERANADPSSPVWDELDLGKVGAAGHSFGAMAALGIAATDSRVDAVVALAPGALHRDRLLEYARTMRDVPVLVVTARHDWLSIPHVFGRPAWDAIPHRRKLYLEVGRAHHFTFCDGSVRGARRTARRYANAWLDVHLLGAADPDGWTDGRKAASDRELSDHARP